MYDRIRGVLDQPVGEGTHFRVPWLQTPNIMDIRTRPRTISSVTGTKGTMRTSVLKDMRFAPGSQADASQIAVQTKDLLHATDGHARLLQTCRW